MGAPLGEGEIATELALVAVQLNVAESPNKTLSGDRSSFAVGACGRTVTAVVVLV